MSPVLPYATLCPYTYSVVGKDLSTMKFSLAAIALLKSVAAVVPSSWEGNLTNQMVREEVVVSSDDF